MAIDEFLDQYTPAELEKLERRDPLKKFSEKVAVMKSLQGHKEASPQRRPGTETSPVRNQIGRDTSPKKRI